MLLSLFYGLVAVFFICVIIIINYCILYQIVLKDIPIVKELFEVLGIKKSNKNI
jgi:hypothetical protein